MVYVFLADGFEEIEALAPVDFLRRAGVEVKTVALNKMSAVGAHSVEVVADVNIDYIILNDDIEAVILPGGMPGTVNLEASAVVQDAIRYALENHLCVGAICAAPSILGHKGYLNGLKATCYPGFESALTGAILSDGVVTDGNVTTGCGPGVAVDFALELVRRLVSAEKANSIREAMQCR